MSGPVPADASDVDHEFIYKNVSFAHRCLSDGQYIQGKTRMDEDIFDQLLVLDSTVKK